MENAHHLTNNVWETEYYVDRSLDLRSSFSKMNLVSPMSSADSHATLPSLHSRQNSIASSLSSRSTLSRQSTTLSRQSTTLSRQSTTLSRASTPSSPTSFCPHSSCFRYTRHLEPAGLCNARSMEPNGSPHFTVAAFGSSKRASLELADLLFGASFTLASGPTERTVPWLVDGRSGLLTLACIDTDDQNASAQYLSGLCLRLGLSCILVAVPDGSNDSVYRIIDRVINTLGPPASWWDRLVLAYNQNNQSPMQQRMHLLQNVINRVQQHYRAPNRPSVVFLSTQAHKDLSSTTMEAAEYSLHCQRIMWQILVAHRGRWYGDQVYIENSDDEDDDNDFNLIAIQYGPGVRKKTYLTK